MMLNEYQSTIEGFFLFGEVPYNVESGAYILPLVLLSFLIASLGSFAGLRLATDIQKAKTPKLKSYLHYGGAFAFGTGIWSMHFIGMLAYDMDMVHTYDPVLTIFSMIIAVGIAYGVLQIVKLSPLTPMKLIGGAFLLGIAICAMHYTGMAAMEMDADLVYIPSLFLLSLIIAVTASGAALWIVFTLGHHEGASKLLWQIFAAMVLGGAICGMHYVGMEAAVFIPYANCRYDPDQHFDGLALAVAISSAVVFAIAIIISLHQRAENAVESLGTIYSGNRVFLQLSSLLAMFLILLVGSYFFLSNNIRKQEDDRTIISAASLQRMLIVRHVQSVTGVLLENDRSVATALLLSASHIDQNYRALMVGGGAVLSADIEKLTKIPPVTEKEAVKLLTASYQNWLKLKKLIKTMNLQVTSMNSMSSSYSQINSQLTNTIHAQDELVQKLQMLEQESNQAFTSKQRLILIGGLITFILTVLYARFFIANRIESARRELSDSRNNLKDCIYEQTKDLIAAKDNAERLNDQMQLYTDKLETARLEQMETNHKLQQEAKTIKLFERVATAVNKASKINEAIQICLNEICSYTGWSVGHAYIYDDEIDRLIPSNIWYVNHTKKFMEFQQVTRQTSFASGEGLPGIVYSTRQPLWIDDVRNDDNFLRVKKIKNINVKTGIGLPVFIKNDVVAVLEFYSTEAISPDEELVRALSNIGTQLGRIVERSQIQNARRGAERANEAKGEFLANMSHELRTPLNSIIGLSRMLMEDAKEKSEEHDMNKTVHKAASYLLEIVNDILDLSKIDAGEITLENIGFDLKDVVAGVIETLAPIASSKGLSLNYKYDFDMLPYLEGDPVRIGRIYTNLISNAIKYTADGSVDILIGAATLENQQIEISCSIVDTGIGIPEEKLSIIFQKFSQADETTTRKYGGTGLGLAITKELVEMMGGEIGVESIVNEGSRFWFKVPFKVAENIHEDFMEIDKYDGAVCNLENRIAVQDANVLIAEDHDLNQIFIQKLLKRSRIQNFDLVPNGLEAVKAYQNKDYDLILMDCHMPEKNGYEATGEIRALEKSLTREGQPIPIVALTADAMAGTREKCLEAGMDDYITKPINADQFKMILSQWLIFTPQEKTTASDDDQAHDDIIIDMSALREYADTSDEMQDFCDTYFVKTEEAIEGLRLNCTDGHNAEWVEIAHQVKGSSGMIGAVELAKHCADAQQMPEVSEAERLAQLATIETSYQRTKAMFKANLAKVN